MSESQFAYSGLTLDELRSLAASPQVGTLHAMPQSFRALADRVGEVADLLTHTQVNMHHWWKGPAAEQAATMLGQAAAEAREFHDTAMGAATAVDHCAQIVSEQQHQMMNVPEVAEPGVTDTVRQPTTPFEALEAMRRDAAYQAAHEQAVQVVNGIAAQYVETRARLSTISTSSGDNFTSPPVPRPPAPPDDRPSYLSSNTDGGGTGFDQPRQFNKANHRPKIHELSTSDKLTRPSEARSYPSHKRSASEPLTESIHFPPTREGVSPLRHATEPAAGLPGNPESNVSSSHMLFSRETVNNEAEEYRTSMHLPLHEETAAKNSETHGQLNTTSWSGASKSSGQLTAAANNRAARTPPSRPTAASTSEPNQPVRLNDQQSEPQFSYRSQFDAANTDSAVSSMIPPYGGLGSARRVHEERNPRPSYLKERKSVWITDTIAAPPDGVLTLEWFEQS